MRQHLPEVAYRDAAPDPLLYALLAPLVVGAFFGWRRSHGIDNIWQRGVIAVLAACGALLVGLLGSVADWILKVPGMIIWAAAAAAAGIAGSRWAVRSSGEPTGKAV
jgi:MYXO-CTERM domain-containing protein